MVCVVMARNYKRPRHRPFKTSRMIPDTCSDPTFNILFEDNWTPGLPGHLIPPYLVFYLRHSRLHCFTSQTNDSAATFFCCCSCVISFNWKYWLLIKPNAWQKESVSSCFFSLSSLQDNSQLSPWCNCHIDILVVCLFFAKCQRGSWF